MVDTTWAVKVPEELKEEIVNLYKELGLQGKDFMQYLLSLYKIEKTKDYVPEIAEDLNELQLLTQRINDIYLNLSYRIENIGKIKEKKFQEEFELKNENIKELEEGLNQLEEKNKELLNDKKTLNEKIEEKLKEEQDFLNKIEHLSIANKSLTELNIEYKEKIKNLNNTIENYEKIKKENIKLKKLSTTLNNKINELTNSINEKEKQIVELQDNIEKTSLSHKQELKILNDKLMNGYDKQILDLQKQNQIKIEELKTKNDKKIEEYQSKIEEMQNMYNDLLKEFNEEIKKNQLKLNNKDK